MGTEICPFCPETRTSSLHHPRLVPEDLLESAALPSGLRAYLDDFHSRLCSEITLAVRWPYRRGCNLMDVVAPRDAPPFLDRWRTMVPQIVILDPRAGLLLFTLPPHAVWQITGATAGLVHARGQFPNEHEWAAIMAGHAKVVQQPVSGCPVAPPVRVARTIGLATEEMALSPGDQEIWGDDRRGLRRRIVTAIGGLRESVLSEKEQERVLEAAVGRQG